MLQKNFPYLRYRTDIPVYSYFLQPCTLQASSDIRGSHTDFPGHCKIPALPQLRFVRLRFPMPVLPVPCLFSYWLCSLISSEYFAISHLSFSYAYGITNEYHFSTAFQTPYWIFLTIMTIFFKLIIHISVPNQLHIDYFWPYCPKYLSILQIKMASQQPYLSERHLWVWALIIFFFLQKW